MFALVEAKYYIMLVIMLLIVGWSAVYLLYDLYQYLVKRSNPALEEEWLKMMADNWLEREYIKKFVDELENCLRFTEFYLQEYTPIFYSEADDQNLDTESGVTESDESKRPLLEIAKNEPQIYSVLISEEADYRNLDVEPRSTSSFSSDNLRLDVEKYYLNKNTDLNFNEARRSKLRSKKMTGVWPHRI